MSNEKCKHFDDCNVPICPEDKESMENCCWFPNEDVCRKSTVPKFVKQQHKIQKFLQDNETFFTCAMLKQNCVVTANIGGIDPNGTETEREKAEQAWLKKHPAKPTMSEEKRQILSDRMKRLHAENRLKPEAVAS